MARFGGGKSQPTPQSEMTSYAAVNLILETSHVAGHGHLAFTGTYVRMYVLPETHLCTLTDASTSAAPPPVTTAGRSSDTSSHIGTHRALATRSSLGYTVPVELRALHCDGRDSLRQQPPRYWTGGSGMACADSARVWPAKRGNPQSWFVTGRVGKTCKPGVTYRAVAEACVCV